MKTSTNVLFPAFSFLGRAALVATVLLGAGCGADGARDTAPVAQGILNAPGLQPPTVVGATTMRTDTLGGIDDDELWGLAAAPTGALYEVGVFADTANLAPAPEVDERTSNGDVDVFVRYQDANGVHRWTATFGGAGPEVPYASAGLSDGVIVAGMFRDPFDADPGPGVLTLSPAGSRDGFIVKLDEAGGLVWARRLGGAGWDTVWDVAAGPDGTLLVTGAFSGSVDFSEDGSGSPTLTSNGRQDAFVLELDGAGHTTAAYGFGGAGYDTATGAAFLADGTRVIVGNFTGQVDLGTGQVPDVRDAGEFDAGYVMLATAGGLARTVQVFDGGDVYPIGAAISTTGQIFVGGYHYGTANFAEAGAYASNGESDMFVAALDSGLHVTWLRPLGGSRYDFLNGIAADQQGGVLVAGTRGTAPDLENPKGDDGAYLARLDASGATDWTRVYESTGDHWGLAVAQTTGGQIAFAGMFSDSLDFNPGGTADDHTAAGYYDAFTTWITP